MNSSDTQKLELILHVLTELFRHQDRLLPHFIGEYCGIDQLPKEFSYPLTYWWIDTNTSNVVVSWNDPLIDEAIVRVANKLAVSVSSDEIAYIRKAHVANTSPYAEGMIRAILASSASRWIPKHSP